MNKLFIIIAIVALLIALAAYHQKKRFLEEAVTAQGKVVALVEMGRMDTDGDPGEMYYAPTVEFTTPAGEHVSFTSLVSNSPAAYKAGQAVKVRYSANNPTQAIIDNFWGRWTLVFVLCVISAAFFLVSVLMGRR